MLKLLSKRVAVDAEHLAGPELIALGVPHDGFQKRLFDGLDHHVIDRRGLGPLQILQIFFEAAPDGFIDAGRLAHASGKEECVEMVADCCANQ